MLIKSGLRERHEVNLSTMIDAERVGVQQAWGEICSTWRINKSWNSNSYDELSFISNPKHYNITTEICCLTGIYPNSIFIKNEKHVEATSTISNDGTCFDTIIITEPVLDNERSFAHLFAHELGHIKYGKIHSKMSFGKLAMPYMISCASNLIMYEIGIVAYPFIGDNLALDVANTMAEILALPVLVNAITMRTRELMADLFAYNATSILPSEVDYKNERIGIIGNILKVPSDIFNYLCSGYPTFLERDLFCLSFGKGSKQILS